GELYNAFFHPGISGSVFQHAAPIWLQMNFKACADGSIKPDATLGTIVQASFMPDVYIFSGSVKVGQNGALTNSPVFSGDYTNFTNEPDFSSTNAYGACLISSRGRGGNPWVMGFFDSSNSIPSKVYYCDTETFFDPVDEGFLGFARSGRRLDGNHATWCDLHSLRRR